MQIAQKEQTIEKLQSSVKKLEDELQEVRVEFELEKQRKQMSADSEHSNLLLEIQLLKETLKSSLSSEDSEKQELVQAKLKINELETSLSNERKVSEGLQTELEDHRSKAKLLSARLYEQSAELAELRIQLEKANSVPLPAEKVISTETQNHVSVEVKPHDPVHQKQDQAVVPHLETAADKDGHQVELEEVEVASHPTFAQIASSKNPAPKDPKVQEKLQEINKFRESLKAPQFGRESLGDNSRMSTFNCRFASNS